MSQTSDTIYISRHTESLQLSSLIFAPIFMPRKTGYSKSKEEDKLKFTLSRTKYEEISYDGYPLDLAEDFPLFSVLVSHVQKHNNVEVVMTENEIFKALNKAKRETNRNSLEAKIDKFKKCNIKIERFDDENNKTRYINTSLVLEADWKRDEGVISFTLSKHFLPANSEETDFELIDLRFYKEFKKEYEKAAFLYLETKKFKKQKTVHLNVNDFVLRVAPNLKKNKEKNRKLKTALESLKEKGYINTYKFYSSTVQGIKMVSIEKNHKYYNLERFIQTL